MSQGAPRSPMKPRRKRSMRTIGLACDKLWSQIVRQKGFCEKCDKTSDEVQLHPHHVVPRTNGRLRFDPRNGCCLCAYHHRYWAHTDALEFADWFRQQRPDDAAYLEAERRMGPLKRTTRDYLDLEAELKALVQREDE